MNLKTAKKLRKLAQLKSIGMPNRRLMSVSGKTHQPVYWLKPDTAINDPQTTRGIYRQLKKEA